MANGNKGKVVGYIRTSSTDQNTSRQLEGVRVDKVFTEQVSGKDSNRPQLKAAIDYLRDDDILVVHSLDRLARNAEDLLRLVRELTGRGVTIKFEKEHLTFGPEATDPFGKLMLSMLASFAEFERSLIRERQREGIAMARARGVYRGRRKALTPAQVADLRQRAAQPGAVKAALAREFGISRETLYAYLEPD